MSICSGRCKNSAFQSAFGMPLTLAPAEAEAERWLWAYRELQQDGSVTRLRKKYLRER